MKPTKKKPAKREVVKGSIEHKRLQLYNRIEKGGAQPAGVTASDKQWVWTLVELIQGFQHKSKHTKLCKEDWLKCNGLWRQYA